MFKQKYKFSENLTTPKNISAVKQPLQQKRALKWKNHLI